MTEPQPILPTGTGPVSAPDVEVKSTVIEPKFENKSDAPAESAQVETSKLETPVASFEKLDSVTESKAVVPTESDSSPDTATEPESAASVNAPPAIIPQIAIPIVALGDEVDDEDANDSAYGDAASATDSSASLASSILKYRNEHGRTYHSYKARSSSFLHPTL